MVSGGKPKPKTAWSVCDLVSTSNGSTAATSLTRRIRLLLGSERCQRTILRYRSTLGLGFRWSRRAGFSGTAFWVGPPLIIATAVVAVLGLKLGWSAGPSTVLEILAAIWCVIILPWVMFSTWREERFARNATLQVTTPQTLRQYIRLLAKGYRDFADSVESNYNTNTLPGIFWKRYPFAQLDRCWELIKTVVDPSLPIPPYTDIPATPERIRLLASDLEAYANKLPDDVLW